MSEIAPPITNPTPRKPRAYRRWALMPLIALLAGLLHWLLFQSQESVSGVITRPLGPFVVDWFGNKGGVLVLGCPHMDLLKLWPLPMEQPWWEDLPVRPGEKVG